MAVTQLERLALHPSLAGAPAPTSTVRSRSYAHTARQQRTCAHTVWEGHADIYLNHTRAMSLAEPTCGTAGYKQLASAPMQLHKF
jgi:hypothetical protein